MHSDHVLSWSLEELARVAGMSRSGFALNFKKKVGLAPMDYLMNWRMQRACELLRATDQNIAVIANNVGYESESAFSIAFKKAIGRRPGAYRKNP
jgi:AraC-like DNA-binding protein